MRPAYRLLARLAHRLPVGPAPLLASLAGRRDAHARWQAWATEHRRSGPLLWVHAASVGEALAAEPVVRRLRTAVRELQVILTHTSPSVGARPGLVAAHQADYLLLDEPAPVAAALAALRPDLLIFSRGDLWPELVADAHARDIPVALLGAQVRAQSGRLRWPVRALLASCYRQLDYVGAVSDADAGRLLRLGVRPTAIEVTGDPRHDQVLERQADLRPLPPLREWKRDLTIVAGSVEQGDEGVLLDTAAHLAADPAVRWLLVPHDPSDVTVRQLAARATGSGLSTAVWSGAGAPLDEVQVLVVAARGLLADLYLLGDVAYVGGGFRRAGLHSVTEPAVFGIPVAFGPRWEDVPDAAALVAGGGGLAVSGAGHLIDAFHRWRTAPTERAAVGLRARAVLGGGAASRSAHALLRLTGWQQWP